MAFKLNAPFNTKQSPIYIRDLEEGVMGKGNKNGTILISDKVQPEDQQGAAGCAVEAHRHPSI